MWIEQDSQDYLGPSNKLILDANSGTLQALDKTQVSRPGLLPEASDGIIAPEIQISLTSGTAFADQGLIMIFHPHFEEVTMHQKEDINIKCTGEPVVIGYCEQTGHRFWRVRSMHQRAHCKRPENCRPWSVSCCPSPPKYQAT